MRKGGGGDRGLELSPAQDRQQISAASGVLVVPLARITHLPPEALNEDAERVRIAAGS